MSVSPEVMTLHFLCTYYVVFFFSRARLNNLIITHTHTHTHRYGEEMSFSVIEIKPECAAGRLFDSFDAEVAFDVMEPLTQDNNNNIGDEDQENDTKSTKRPTLSRTPSALERERKAANEAFERKWQEEQDQKTREERRRQR